MNILIVEDEDAFFDALVILLETNLPDASIIRETTRDGAINSVGSNFFDLIFLDLKIPASSDSLSPETAHGVLVKDTVRSIAPGTPLIVLTGSAGEPDVYNNIIPGLFDDAGNFPIWGGEQLPIVKYISKHRLDMLPPLLKKIGIEYRNCKEVELDTSNLVLSEPETRLIRIFCTSYKGKRCRIRSLTGGLSGARVLKLHLTSSDGLTIFDAVAKIGSRKEIENENQRFNEHVMQLNAAATPRKITMIRLGAKDQAAIFYQLVEDASKNAFDICRDNSVNHADFITSVSLLTEKWQQTVERTCTVKDVRRYSISDEKLASIRDKISLEWIEIFEDRQLQVRQGCAHGDMHGANILVSNTLIPVLIDYGDVGYSSPSLDPITLELSAIFHVDGPMLNSDWPNFENCRKWGNLEEYISACPHPEFISRCRSWANEVAAGKREIAAVAYGYVLRQLKYDRTSVPRAIALLEGIKFMFDAT